MREERKKRLQAKGWKIGSVKELLRLSDEESAYIEKRLAKSDFERCAKSPKQPTPPISGRRAAFSGGARPAGDQIEPADSASSPLSYQRRSTGERPSRD